MGFGIYIHIPFCKQKCFYCDFASTAKKVDETLYEQYINALCQEITMYQALFPDICIDTIYFGGGTPSILPPNLIIRALNTVKANFTLNSDIEITLEANPGTVDEQKLQYLYQNGINRLSFGVQAVQDDLLQKIGRIHTIKEAEMAIEMAQKIGFKNISVDLMYGLPGQTLEMLKEAVSWAVNKNIQHISIYGLQIEENTVFGRLYDQGKLILPSEDKSEMMYDYLTEQLPKYNYNRYEISNFAKIGYESRHNLAYWQDKFYLGLGAGAHGYYNQKRVQNPFDIDEYIKKCNQKILPFINEEIVDEKAHIEEFCFLGLRMAKGIDKEIFKQKFNTDIENLY
uniref:radical SAM family heme chaperone HemW n=1 Tax=Megamonas sp. TaxID=2049033 RepID=UPI00258DD295